MTGDPVGTLTPEATHHHAGEACNKPGCWLNPACDGPVWDNGHPIDQCTPINACTYPGPCKCRQRFRLLIDPVADHPTTSRYV